MGPKGGFLSINLKNNIYKIFDDITRNERIINKTLKYFRNKKEVKSYKII